MTVRQDCVERKKQNNFKDGTRMKTRIVSRMVALLSLFAVVSPNFVPDAIGQEELSEAVPAEDLDSLDKFDATENPKAPDTRG